MLCRRTSRRCMRWPGVLLSCGQVAGQVESGRGVRRLGFEVQRKDVRQHQQRRRGQRLRQQHCTRRQGQGRAMRGARLITPKRRRRAGCAAFRLAGQDRIGLLAAVVVDNDVMCVMPVTLCKPRQGLRGRCLAGVGLWAVQRAWFANGRRGCLQKRATAARLGQGTRSGFGRISAQLPQREALHVSLYTGPRMLQGWQAGGQSC